MLTLVLVPALLPRGAPARPRASLSMPRLAAWIVRRTQRDSRRRARRDRCVLGVAATRLRINPTLDRLRSVTPDAALLAADRADVRPARATSTSCWRGRATSRRCSRRTSGSRAALAAALPGAGGPGADARCCRRSRRRRARQARDRAAPAVAAGRRAGARRRREQAEGFTPGSFDPFRERLPRCSIRAAPHLRRLRRARPRRPDRPLRRARGRSLAAGDVRVSRRRAEDVAALERDRRERRSVGRR